MAERQDSSGAPGDGTDDSFRLSAPQISLPKGGGAIRGIGEKFAANPVTGTGSMTVPLATSPGRSGFGPQLSIDYDSGAGNGPFGFGWALSLPAITRKTEKGLPRYRDSDESDIFILSGAEDLVPEFRRDSTREPPDNWIVEDGAPVVHEDSRVVDDKNYRVRRYRPRIEGLFARIERWTNDDDPADCFWRSISPDNVTTWYGKRGDSRIADPADPSRIFSWLICESHDDKGNVIEYEYLPEDERDLDLARANERNRTRTANRYLKFIRYGNHAPYLPKLGVGPWPSPPEDQWYFEVVFDYGEHDAKAPLPRDGETHDWTRRNDPFSTYRAGFEVRTYRLCQRVLMFHHFDNEPVGRDCLVRSTDLFYSYEADPGDARNPVYSFLSSVAQTAYERDDTPNADPYRKRSLPPLEFEYSRPEVDETIRDVDAESLRNLPSGLGGAGYQWIDLDGEGLSGVLTEQGTGWFYKRNLSAANLVEQSDGSTRAETLFGSVELVASRPSAPLGKGHGQFMDLEGDGQPDLVVHDGSAPGFFEHHEGTRWSTFRAFIARLNRDTRDPNLRFLDLDGDGRADVLVTEDDALAWHASLGEQGFAPAQRIAKQRDEERGPALVLADVTQSIYLADMSGDGLTDLVRIRNGEICYWPNLGFGNFGPKVTMDDAPWFDAPDLFDHRRLLIADVDGSGTTDIIYLHGDGARLYFNQSGNGWGRARELADFPRIDNVSSVNALDLLGNGTACLVWSSALPGATHRPMRYVDLMGGQKPHLLVKTKNNLGATSEITYAPSTKFYLQDRANGKPWLTRLPFPVHVVERVSATDKWRGTTFATTYSYHHGYFDGVEREFRGFGRVEQVDVEDYGKFSAGNVQSPYITDDHRLFQPPVKTVTWFHTGAFVDAEPALSPYRAEYFPAWFEAARPGSTDVLGGFEENVLPEPDFADINLTADEWRQALRACKGMMLRKEVYELDVDALRASVEERVKLFSAAFHNCHVDRLQPQVFNRHAVFLVTESEAMTYHYELDLRAEQLRPDPRVAHTANLRVDEFGRVLESVAIGYRRFDTALDVSLPLDGRSLAADVQTGMCVAYVESAFTAELDETQFPDTHRLGLPCETRTYDVTGLDPEDVGDRNSGDPRDNRYFSIDELRGAAFRNLQSLEYHAQPDPPGPARRVQKRIVAHTCTRYFDDASDTAEPTAPLPLREHGPRGLKYEDYKLALTENLLAAVFRGRGPGGATIDKLADEVEAGTDVRALLRVSRRSGYVEGVSIDPAFTQQYWVRSGTAGFEPDAPRRFFLPRRFADGFGNVTKVAFDASDLFIASTTDPRGNVTRVRDFDFRLLAPRALQDVNGSVTRATYDVLGMPCAVALEATGDGVAAFDGALRDPTPQDLAQFFGREANNPPAPYTQALPRRWLDAATTRFIYHFGEVIAGNETTYAVHPAAICGIRRETHVSQLAGAEPKIQVAIEYSDGGGKVFVQKAQAEPDPDDNAADAPLRWIASGKTVLNNKGKVVKKYEPYFSDTGHRFDATEATREIGSTSIIYYDAVARVVRTEFADGSYSRVVFSPWSVATFDANDTVGEFENPWYARNSGAAAGVEEQRAASFALAHRDTPGRTVLDSLGRDVIAIAHNRLPDSNGSVTIEGASYRDEFHLTFTKLDAKGDSLWIRDARQNIVVQYVNPRKRTRFADEPNEDLPPGATPCYDIAGNLLFQHSMDAGDRWMLMDAAARPMVAWDQNDRGPNTAAQQRFFFTEYDELHRPVSQRLSIDGGPMALVEVFEYCDTDQPNGAVSVADAQERNLIAQAVRHWDSSGLSTVERLDVSGQAAHVTRTLVAASSVTAQDVVDWNVANRDDWLDDEVFRQITEYDALGRIVRLYHWHRDVTFSQNGDTLTPGATNRVAVYEPEYNARGKLSSERIHVRARKATANDRVSFTASQQYSHAAIEKITYDAKGQRLSLELGNNTFTRYSYDPQTFRLTHLFTRRRGSVAALDCASNSADQPRPRRPCGVQNLHYTYDPVGNITHIHDDAQHTIYFDNAVVEPSNDYRYDALYRLIEAKGREHASTLAPPQPREGPWPEAVIPSADALRNYTQRYAYDAAGNFLEMEHSATGGGWTRRYESEPDSNRLRRTWYGNNTVEAVRHRYDARGNMLNLNRIETPPSIDPGDEWGLDIRWDWRDQIMALDLGGGGSARYHYGVDKRRTRKTIEKQGSVEDRIYLDGYELYRRYRSNDPDNAVEEIESLHLLDGEQRLLLIDDVIETDRRHPNGTAYQKEPIYRFQYSNHLGSVCLELDDAAKIISYEEYHPYGTSAYRAMKRGVEAPPKRYRFTGMERDEESGLGSHGARSYSSLLGRWISPDPSGVANDIDLYRYCACNPIGSRDLTGLAGAPPKIPDARPPNSTGIGAEAHRDILSRLAVFMAAMRNPAIPMPYQAKVEEPTQPGGSKPGPNQGLNPGQVDLVVFETKYAGLISGESSHVLYAHFYELKPFFEGWNDSRLRPENTKTTWDRQLQNYLMHDKHVEAPGEFYDTKFGTILERYRAIVETPFPVPKGGFTRWYKLRLPPGPDGKPIPGLIEYTYVDRSAAEEEAAEKEAATAAAAAKAQDLAKKQAEEAVDKLLPITQAASSFIAELTALVESVAPAVGTGTLIAVDTLAAPITFLIFPQILNDPQKSDYPGT